MRYNLRKIENEIPFSADDHNAKRRRSKGGKELTYNQYRTSLLLEEAFKSLQEQTIRIDILPLLIRRIE